MFPISFADRNFVIYPSSVDYQNRIPRTYCSGRIYCL